MTLLRRTMLCAVFFSLAGCASVGMFTKTNTFTGRDKITLPAKRADVLELLAAAGKSLNYDVTGLDKEHKIIELTRDSSGMSTVLIGKTSMTILQLTVEDTGNSVAVDVATAGNMGSGDLSAAEKVVQEYRAVVMEKFK